MEIIKYSEDWKEKWDQFVLESNNGTMFHLQKFLDYHTPGKFRFDHLIFTKYGKIEAVLPGALRNGIYESPIGASYGSIVTKDIKFAEAMEIVSALLDYGKKNNIKEFELTSAPMIYEKYQNQNLEFAMRWLGFDYKLHYISSAINLRKGEDYLLRFSPTTRRNVRKTFRIKDLRIEINERYDQFYPILVENKAKHNSKPTHSYDDLIKLKQLLPNNLVLFMVYLGEKPIGGSLVFIANRNVALCFYNMMLYEFAEYKPMHRIMYDVVNYATDKGYSYVDIGVSQDTKAENPMTPSMSLIEFKEQFDAKTIMRNNLSIKL
ncbi:MAG TPA: GNAT family N-acetyltransferase [Melioribacteraceae bacterium]|nr:GNAT family N-acetyltransferase [Melioribacteraceae bacterium]